MKIILISGGALEKRLKFNSINRVFESITMQISLPQSSLSVGDGKHSSNVSQQKSASLRSSSGKTTLMSKSYLNTSLITIHNNEHATGKWILIEIKLLEACTDDFLFSELQSAHDPNE